MDGFGIYARVNHGLPSRHCCRSAARGGGSAHSINVNPLPGTGMYCTWLHVQAFIKFQCVVCPPQAAGNVLNVYESIVHPGLKPSGEKNRATKLTKTSNIELRPVPVLKNDY